MSNMSAEAKALVAQMRAPQVANDDNESLPREQRPHRLFTRDEVADLVERLAAAQAVSVTLEMRNAGAVALYMLEHDLDTEPAAIHADYLEKAMVVLEAALRASAAPSEEAT